MKKMIKTLLALSLVLLLVGCKKTQVQPFTLQLFYYDTCSRCNAFKESALPDLRHEFGEALTIEYYNLDSEEGLNKYNEVIQNLDQFDQEYYKETPLIVIDQHFAVVGYNGQKENEELIKEIKRSLNNEPLGDYFTMGRYKFKQGE